MPSNKRKPGRPTGRKQTASIFARISPQLAQVFNDQVEAIRPKTSASAVVEMLIERWLTEQGYWPPPGKEGDGK